MFIVITERDKQVIQFLVKWRFATIEQLAKAGIFNTTKKRCYIRLLDLCKDSYIKSNQLANRTMYYHLLSKGAEILGINLPWYSRIFKGAGDSRVIQHLTFCDYAQAMSIEYIPFVRAVKNGNNLMQTIGYDTLKGVVCSQDRFYYHQGELHALVVDFGLSLKYMTQRANNYARLPAEVKNKLTVVFLVFTEGKRLTVAKAIQDSGLKAKIMKANWKY